MNRSLVCKHKHVLKNGAPPDKFEVLHGFLQTDSFLYQ